MSKISINRFALISVLFATFLLFADETPQQVFTNEKIARRMLVEPALQYLFMQVGDSAKLTFALEETNADLLGWMKQNLVDSCIAHGYSVYNNPENIQDTFEIVEISEPEILFEYKSAGKKWLFFNKGFKRIVTGDFHFSIRKNSGKIIFSRQISKTYEDIVSNIEAIENETLPFTKGKRSGSSIAKKLIEPVLITASAVTVVYLFYSLRSGN